jgi:DNA-binding NtrC family response regulator
MQWGGRGDIVFMTARMMNADARRADPPKRPDATIDAATLDHLTDEFLSLLNKNGAGDLPLKALMEALEKSVILRALTAFNGHQAKAAAFLRLLPTTLSAKMRKHQILVESTWTAVPEASASGAASNSTAPPPDGGLEPDPDPDD